MRSNLGLRQLEAIVAIATHGSFSAASEQLFVSQPALSRTIRLAEESLGAKLFDRGTRSVTLTPAGAELLPIAKRIVLEFRDSMSELSQFMEGRRGRVRVSALPSTAQTLVVDAVASFTQVHPNIEFLVRTERAETVLSLLETGDVDVGVTVQPPPDGRFHYDHLHDEEFVLICRAEDALVTQQPIDKPLTWRAFEGQPFIAASPGSNTRTATDHAFIKSGMTIRPAHEVASSNLSIICAMVAAGLGMSVLPANALAALNQPKLVSRRLMQPVMKRSVGIVTLKGRTKSTATTRFCAHLQRK
jgi:DNA-binding transcriptional LysR family regulator